MFNLNKLGLGYENIVLKHNKGIVESRSDCDVSVNLGGITLSSPVFLSNMKFLQEKKEILDIFNKRKWGYIYHRLNGIDDIFNFTKKINNEDWYFKSICIGVQSSDWHLLNNIKKSKLKLDCLCIDLAFIYTLSSLEFVKKVRALFPNVYLIAGNFDNWRCAVELQEIGVDCGKFGIGVSAKCKTRQRTSIGTCILSDLIQCREKTNKLEYLLDGGLVITEDGEVQIGDCWKAINFGAKFILSASLFQRITELADINGNILCYGNSTERAKNHSKYDEGTEFFVKTDGRSLEKQMDRIIDSGRSFCSYAGVRSIKDAYNVCDYNIVL